MPSFQIFTNVPASDIPPNFCEEMTEELMTILGKPKKFVMIHVIAGQAMTFAGTQVPTRSQMPAPSGIFGGETREF